MSKSQFLILVAIVFPLLLFVVAWTSLKFGSDDDVDMRSLKGKKLTDKQIKKIKALGLSDQDIDDLTK
jgi:hypothetical protein